MLKNVSWAVLYDGKRPQLLHLHFVSDFRAYPAWYKSALFNELYFMSDGGSVWLELQEDQANGNPASPNGTQDQPCKMAQLRKDMGLFAYLEGE